jgi:hypothetical protein
LKPERWGSLLVQEEYQEEMACDNNNNNNNNNIQHPQKKDRLKTGIKQEIKNDTEI